MHVSKDGLERIKGANPLEQLAAERGIKLKKRGQVVVGLCPFHREKSPSFTITPSKGLFHCFGCDVAGDVIGFVVKHDKVSFRDAVEVLCRRAGIDAKALMVKPARTAECTPVEALTPPVPPNAAELLATVVEHYHESFCENADAQQYLMRRGITDADLLRALKVGHADGSLLKRIPKTGELRDGLRQLGVLTAQGRELMGGCIVVPIPDPVSGAWTNLYGRGVRTDRHCYLPRPLGGVLNFQAARSADELVLTESIIDALSFFQVGIATAIPLYGSAGMTPDHLDVFKRDGVRRVILALDNDEPGRRTTEALKERLTAAGIAVRVASLPSGIKDPNELLVSCNGTAGEAFRRLLDEAEPRPVAVPCPPVVEAPSSQPNAARDGFLSLNREGRSYEARPHGSVAGRLRVTVRVSNADGRFHLDTIDLLLSRSRADFARKAARVLGLEASAVEHLEADLLTLLVEAEKAEDTERGETTPAAPVMTEAERAEALALLRRPDHLDQVVRDAWALGFVGEEVNIKLIFLVAISRLADQPLSAVILSQSGAGKSLITEIAEQLTPPEHVVLITRLTPQSLYYIDAAFLDHKLVLIEERHGSQEADYSIRVLQSRGKLVAAAPVKDPATGNLKTRIFEVVARAAFIEATTATEVHHENATRCFELTMDESVEQTRRIHERQRYLKTEAGLLQRQQAELIRRRHWNAQRLLERLPVVIPYADHLSFPVAWMRTRRDHARFLNLIDVSAFVHQHQRERCNGAVVATLADYEVAYSLAGQVLAETLSDLKKPLRDAYGRVSTLCQERGGSVSRREIREALQLPDSTVRGWLAQLVELEYLDVEASKGGAGKTARYRVSERGPRGELALGLLSPAELAARLRPGR